MQGQSWYNYFSNKKIKHIIVVQSLSHAQLFCDPMGYCNPMDCSPPGSSVHGILQARILEQVAISFSGDLSNPGIQPTCPASAGRFFTAEPPRKTKHIIGTHLLNKYADTDGDQPLEKSSWSISQFIRDSCRVRQSQAKHLWSKTEGSTGRTLEVRVSSKFVPQESLLPPAGLVLFPFPLVYYALIGSPSFLLIIQKKKSQVTLFGRLRVGNQQKIKGKEKRKDIPISVQSSKEQQGQIRKPSSVINAKKQRKTIEQERLEISSRKLEIPREYFMQRWAQ